MDRSSADSSTEKNITSKIKLISNNKNENKLQNNETIKISDFSIDHILNRAGENRTFCGTNNSNFSAVNFYESLLNGYKNVNLNNTTNTFHHNFNQNIDDDIEFNTADTTNNLILSRAPIFDWLQYTRYRPPKLPRPFRPGPVKRTPGRLPRVPFTPGQLNSLENAYKSSSYLSSEEANKLAVQLDLTNTRVKIWFQNRRARERREKRERGESPDALTPSSSPELNLISDSP